MKEDAQGSAGRVEPPVGLSGRVLTFLQPTIKKNLKKIKNHPLVYDESRHGNDFDVGTLCSSCILYLVYFEFYRVGCKKLITLLSGHSVTKINDKLVCIIGREGSVRIQRKWGQMYFLHINLQRFEYFYTEAPMMLESRSGHTAQLAPNLSMYVFGGRDSGTLQIYGKPTPEICKRPEPLKDLKNDILEKYEAESVKTMIGLRYHAMVVIDSDCILIHGGRNFKAISGKDINATTFVCKKYTKSESWFQFKSPSTHPRFAHTLVVHDGQISIFGGFVTEQDDHGAKTDILFS